MSGQPQTMGQQGGILEPSSKESAVADASSHHTPRQAGQAKPRSAHPCNFRLAGRLSNEMARSLTVVHDTLARYLAGGLDAQLGAGIKMKLLTLDRLPIEEHIANVPPLSLIVPLSIGELSSTVIVECDIHLIFPIMDRLLGGSGVTMKETGELSEIEEEIVGDIASLIARQIESAWAIPRGSLAPGDRIKVHAILNHCSPNDKLTVARFEMEMASQTGWVQVVYPSTFINTQIKQLGAEQPKKNSRIKYFPASSMRERILDGDVTIAAALPSIGVQVRDLIELRPGSILQLKTPVKTPGILTVEGREFFQAIPVRNGTRKAAQLGHPLQPAQWEGDTNG
jgi:flagellar motor switch protein FliM